MIYKLKKCIFSLALLANISLHAITTYLLQNNSGEKLLMGLCGYYKNGTNAHCIGPEFVRPGQTQTLIVQNRIFKIKIQYGHMHRIFEISDTLNHTFTIDHDKTIKMK